MNKVPFVPKLAPIALALLVIFGAFVPMGTNIAEAAASGTMATVDGTGAYFVPANVPASARPVAVSLVLPWLPGAPSLAPAQLGYSSASITLPAALGDLATAVRGVALCPGAARTLRDPFASACIDLQRAASDACAANPIPAGPTEYCMFVNAASIQGYSLPARSVAFDFAVRNNEAHLRLDLTLTGSTTPGPSPEVTARLHNPAWWTTPAPPVDVHSTAWFEVVPGPLARYDIQGLPERPVAGATYTLAITPEDEFGNAREPDAIPPLLQTSDPKATTTPSSVTYRTAGSQTLSVCSAPRGDTSRSFCNTLLVTVDAGPLARIALEDATGAPLAAPVILTSGGSATWKVGGFDAFDNRRPDPIGSWSVVSAGDACVSIPAPSTPSSAKLVTATRATNDAARASSAPVACRVEVRVGALPPATSGPIAVTTGALARLEVHTAPAGAGQPAGDAELTADDAIPLFAVGYDAAGNSVGAVAATWTIEPGSSACGDVTAQGSAALFDATTPGVPNCRVVATAPGAQPGSTGLIRVSPGRAVALSIRHVEGTKRAVGATDIFVVGDVYGLAATQQDSDGNLFPAPATTSWSVLGGCAALDRASGSSVLLSPTAPTSEGPECRVRASVPAPLPAPPAPADSVGPAEGMSAGPLVALTPPLTTAASEDLTILRLRTQPGGGGIAVHSVTLTADETQQLCAAGYDQDLHYLGDFADAMWSLTPASNGSLSAATGTCVTYAPGPVGDAAIRADARGLNETVSVEVVPGEPVALRVLGETGQPPNLEGAQGGASVALRALGRDARGNDAEEISHARWRVDGGCAGASAEEGPEVVLTFGYVPRASCSLHVTAAGLPDVPEIPLSIATPTIDHVRVVDATGGAGAEVADVALTADEEATLWVAAFDEGDHYVGDVSATWTVIGSNATLVGENPAASITLDPHLVGDARVGATYAAGMEDVTGVFTISAGALAQIRIETEADGTGAAATSLALPPGEDSDPLHAVARDSEGNFIGLASTTWSLEGCVTPLLGREGGCIGTLEPASGPTTRFHATSPGRSTIWANDTAGRASGWLGAKVNARPLDFVRIEVSPDGRHGTDLVLPVGDLALALTADMSVTLCVRGFADDGEDQGYQDATWSLMGAPTGAFTHAGSCVEFDPRRAGEGTIVAEVAQDGGPTRTDSMPVNVSPGRFAGFHFWSIPDPVVAGERFDTTVSAVDQDLNNATYAGAVRFETNDTAAEIPSGPQPLTSASPETFPFTMGTVGDRALLVTDVARVGTPLDVTRSLTLNVTPGDAATLVIDGLVAQTAGASFSLALRALDVKGNLATGFVGEFDLGSTCGVELATTGAAPRTTFAAGISTTPQLVTTTASAACALSLVGSPLAIPAIVVQPAALDRIELLVAGSAVDAVTSVPAGAVAIAVTAKDAYGNTRTQDNGPVTLTAFPVALQGAGTLALTNGAASVTTLELRTATRKSVSDPSTEPVEVVNVTFGSVTNETAPFRVEPASAHHYQVDVLGDEAKTAGVPFPVNVSVEDRFGNTHWEAFAPAPTITSNAEATFRVVSQGQLTDGNVTFTVEATRQTGARQIDAAGLANAPEGTRTYSLFAARAASVNFTGAPAYVAGTPTATELQAHDAFGNANLTTTGTGTLRSDCSLESDPVITLASGVATSSVNLTKAGACWLNATVDSGPDAPLYANTTLDVLPGAAHHFGVELPETATAGAAITITIRDRDAWENAVTTASAQRILVFQGEAAYDGTPATVRATPDAEVPFGREVVVTFTQGVATATVRLPRAAEQAVTVTQRPTSPTASPLAGSTEIAVTPAAHARLGILRVDGALATRGDILASEGVNGRATPFEATSGQKYTFFAGSFDEFDNLIGPGQGLWTDQRTVNVVANQACTPEPVDRCDFRWTLRSANGATAPEGWDEVELIPEADVVPAASLLAHVTRAT